MNFLVPRVCALAYGLWALTVVAHVLDIVAIMADLPPVMGDIVANIALSAWFLSLSAFTVVAVVLWVDLEETLAALLTVLILSSVTEVGRIIFFQFARIPLDWIQGIGIASWVVASVCARSLWYRRAGS